MTRILLLLVSLVALGWAQEPQAPPKAAGRPMPEPKNLKVLKVPNSELIPTMRTWATSLGVRCDFCHVQGNFAADEKPNKEMARKMVTMTEHINANFPDGKAHVTCYTCHRGDQEPKTMAPAPAAPEAPKPPQP